MVSAQTPRTTPARGKIITPLKDRIGSRSGRTTPRHDSTRWRSPAGSLDGRACGRGCRCRTSFARSSKRWRFRPAGSAGRQALRRSQRLRLRARDVISNAERRGLLGGESPVSARDDIYAALPPSRKFELEYEGECAAPTTSRARSFVRRRDRVRRDVRRADLAQVTEWFELGGTLNVEDTLPAAELLQRTAVVQGSTSWPRSPVSGPRGRNAARRRRRFRPRRPLRAEEDQPLGRLAYQGTSSRAARRAPSRPTEARPRDPDDRNKKKYYN